MKKHKSLKCFDVLTAELADAVTADELAEDTADVMDGLAEDTADALHELAADVDFVFAEIAPK